MSQIEKSSVIKTSAASLFAFFLDPKNLSRISPPGTEMLDLKAPPILSAGEVFSLTTKAGFRRVHWEGRVVRLEAPRLMVDEQVSGPFKKFVHTHRFRDMGGHTLLIDHVDYELPFGPLGRLCDAVFVHRRLSRMFEYRHKRLKELFEGTTVPG